MKLRNIIILCILTLCSVQCKKVLEKNDLSAINQSQVWNDAKLATAYLNNLYADNLPGWPDVSQYSDDAPGGGEIMYGQLTINSIDDWPYSSIRNNNTLLANVEEGSLDHDTKESLKGQAFFLRAWRYFEMVRLYGGVPLILKPEQLTDSLLASRNKTSECINQIILDLDSAANILPANWTGDDLGRVTKGAALALKGRVLLYYASPQFNPGNLEDRWQNAYNANKEARDFLVANGFGLYESFSNLWFNEMNKSVVFVNRYQYPNRVNTWNAATRPLEEAVNYTGANHPTLERVNAFPMKSGLSISNPASGYDPIHYWLNRDPRFIATIAYNGCDWPLSGKTGRRQWVYVGSQKYAGTETGFYCRKAVDVSYTPFYTQNSSTDWVEIRFAEVIMNLAECANEIGKTDEAYPVLKEIRERAGIDAGSDGMYGLKPEMNKAEMLDAIMLERNIEFAYEGKRYWDLRRRRLFGDMLNGKVRHGYVISLKIPREQFEAIADTVNLDKSYSTYFKDSLVVLDKVFSIDFKDNYYFYAIPQSYLELDSHLEQTNGWPGGSFDPLK